MRTLIAGSNGMVGSAVTHHLLQHKHQVFRLVRREPGAGEVFWDPDAGQIDQAGLEGFDAVIFAHSHIIDYVEYDRGERKKVYLNPGDFVKNSTYIEYTSESGFQIKAYRAS